MGVNINVKRMICKFMSWGMCQKQPYYGLRTPGSAGRQTGITLRLTARQSLALQVELICSTIWRAKGLLSRATSRLSYRTAIARRFSRRSTVYLPVRKGWEYAIRGKSGVL